MRAGCARVWQWGGEGLTLKIEEEKYCALKISEVGSETENQPFEHWNTQAFRLMNCGNKIAFARHLSFHTQMQIPYSTNKFHTVRLTPGETLALSLLFYFILKKRRKQASWTLIH